VYSLTLEQVRRHFLTSQCLDAQAGDVEEAARRTFGVRGSEATTPYLSLFWRVQGFSPAMLDEAVHRRRSLLRIRTPRLTYYWVTPEQARLFFAATKRSDLEHVARWFVSPATYLDVRDEIMRLLQGGTILSGTELTELAPPRLHRTVREKGGFQQPLLAVVLDAMQVAGELLTLKEPGWERHRPTHYSFFAWDRVRPTFYGLIADLAPAAAEPGPEPREAQRALVREHIRTFGPVSAQELAWWTTWKVGEVNGLLKEMDGLVQVEVEGLKGTFYMLPEQWERAREVAPVPAGIWFLPVGDRGTSAYGNGARWQQPHHDPAFYRWWPPVLVDGAAAGRWGWRLEPDRLDLVCELFDQPDAGLRTRLNEAAQRAGAFIAPDRSETRLRILVRPEKWDPKKPW
jgi:hypothetical protein